MNRSTQSGAWKPLLTGQSRAEALATIECIARVLRRPYPALRFKTDSESDRAAADMSLAGGKAGFSLFYAYLARSFSSDDDFQTAADYLQEAITSMEMLPMSTSLYRGFTGIAWATAHLSKSLFDEDEANSHSSVDELLRHYLRHAAANYDYDLINGLVGIGVYALERLQNGASHDCLELVIDRLSELSQAQERGVTWPTPLELRPHWRRRGLALGLYDLGLAHGVPGVVSFLGEVGSLGICQGKVLPLLRGAVAWLLLQNLKTRPSLSFPHYVVANEKPKPARSAWCYGDIGISLALLRGARAAHEPGWEDKALELALSAAERMKSESQIVDAGLCHGAFGVGHLFNRLFQAFSDERFEAAATFWFQKGLNMRRNGNGLAGFSTKMTDFDGETSWVKDPGFLTGVTGIGLSLLAATTEIEPEWDRLMLVSVPPSDHG